MQTANILLGIGGGRDNIVPKYGVTAAEIAVLRAIHGEDAVFDVEPAADAKVTNRAELVRLNQIYGGAINSNGEGIVATMFPGAAARVFENLDELEIPDEFYKPRSRESAKPASSTSKADDGPKTLDKMTKAELVAYAKTHDIEVDDKAKVDEIRQAIAEAEGQNDDGDGGAEDGTDEDGIGNMPPAGGVLS